MQSSEAVWKRCSPLAQVLHDHALPLFLEKENRNSSFHLWGLDNNFVPPFKMLQRPKQPLQSLDDTVAVWSLFPLSTKKMQKKNQNSQLQRTVKPLSFLPIRKPCWVLRRWNGQNTLKKVRTPGAPENPGLVDKHRVLGTSFLRHSYLELFEMFLDCSLHNPPRRAAWMPSWFQTHKHRVKKLVE